MCGVDRARWQVYLLEDNRKRIGPQRRGRNYVTLPEHGVGLLHGLDVQVYFFRLKPPVDRREFVAYRELGYIWHVVFQRVVCSVQARSIIG